MIPNRGGVAGPRSPRCEHVQQCAWLLLNYFHACITWAIKAHMIHCCCWLGCRCDSVDYSDDGQSMQPRIKHGMVLPFCPVTLTFRNIHYFVDLPAVSSVQSCKT